jgi:hypothetical protein
MMHVSVDLPPDGVDLPETWTAAEAFADQILKRFGFVALVAAGPPKDGGSGLAIERLFKGGLVTRDVPDIVFALRDLADTIEQAGMKAVAEHRRGKEGG